MITSLPLQLSMDNEFTSSWFCLFITFSLLTQLPWWFRWSRICLQFRRPGFSPWVEKMPWRRKWYPTPLFLPGESHGQRHLAGYTPWDCKQSDTTEQLSLSLFIINNYLSCSAVSGDETRKCSCHNREHIVTFCRLFSFKKKKKVELLLPKHWIEKIFSGYKCKI